MHASCIIYMCIMATCIRIKNICIIHPTPRIALFVRPFVRWSPKSTASYIHTPPQIHASSGSWNRIIDLCIVHHTSVNQGSRIIYMCIIHTCIRVKDRGSYICASYIHVSGSRIMDKCIMVTCIRIKKICIAHAYYKHQESYIHTCFRIKVQYHRYHRRHFRFSFFLQFSVDFDSQ